MPFPNDRTSYKLPRRVVFKHSLEIRNILKNGEKLSGSGLDVYILRNKEKKFAVLVQKKLGKAVERNRMKRLIREIYRLHPNWFDNMQIIFYVKKKNFSYSSLENEIEKLMALKP